jgi:lysophospholipid acyltransferase (LPLAT)-like uncharacterized protein
MTRGLKSISLRVASFLLFYFFRLLIWFYRLTSRIEVAGDLDAVMNQPDPVLLTCWHQDLFYTFSYLTRYAKRRPISVLVSRSDDGAPVAGLVARFGFIPVRGSSSRGGATAFSQLCDRVKIDRSVAAIVCDGPRPPARVAKRGSSSFRALPAGRSTCSAPGQRGSIFLRKAGRGWHWSYRSRGSS